MAGKRGRPRKNPPVDPDLDDLIGDAPEPENPDWAEFVKPVSVTFLMQVFKLDRLTVKKKLAELPPIRMVKGGVPEYDFRQAASYLVKPKVDIAEYIKTLRPTDLPAYLQDQWWAAQLKRQKWQKEAGELWPTSDVIAVFGDVFQHMKTTMQLWVDQIAEQHAVTPAIRSDLVQLVDGLQRDLHDRLVAMPKETARRNQLREFDDLPAEGDDGSLHDA